MIALLADSFTLSFTMSLWSSHKSFYCVVCVCLCLLYFIYYFYYYYFCLPLLSEFFISSRTSLWMHCKPTYALFN